MLENEIPESLQKKLVDAALGKLAEDECPDCKLLLNMYLNDKNSSTARQLVTARICGYKNSNKKMGFDAIDEFGNHKEIKPTNVLSSSIKRYSGSFGFSDYTSDRYGKDVQADVKILQALFVDGNPLYIFEFPIIDINEKMNRLIEKHIVQNKQRYIRKAEFSFNNLKKENIEIKFVSPDLDKFSYLLSKKIYNFIKGIKP